MKNVILLLVVSYFSVCAVRVTAQPRPHNKPIEKNKLCCGKELVMGDPGFQSPNGRYYLIFQGDKNLVLYKKKPGGGEQPLWATATNNRVNRCVMQGDGNLVLYNNNNPVWATNTGGNANAQLVLQDDGNLVIYAANGRVLWTSNTAQPEDVKGPKNELCCGKELTMGDNGFESPNGKFFLVFQGDRNLVLYMKERGGTKPLWATATNNRVNRCVMQGDGNLVLYNNNQAVWASNTGGNTNARLVLQDDGNLVIYSQNGRPVWTTNTAQPVEAPRPKNELCCGKELAMSDTGFESPNGKFYLVFQGDRNLVLYMREPGGAKPLWATGTNNRANRCIMQGDGNLVLYNNNQAVWASNTGGNMNARLVLQDDGNLVIYSKNGQSIWASNTAQSVEVKEVVKVEVVETPVETVVVTQNTGPCSLPHRDFNAAVEAINNQSFKEQKMAVAKQAIKNKCLSLEQIRELAGLFSFEDQTLEFLKYAYDFTNSKGDYYTLSDIFSFNSNVKKFTEFLESK